MSNNLCPLELELARSNGSSSSKIPRLRNPGCPTCNLTNQTRNTATGSSFLLLHVLHLAKRIHIGVRSRRGSRPAGSSTGGGGEHAHHDRSPGTRPAGRAPPRGTPHNVTATRGTAHTTTHLPPCKVKYLFKKIIFASELRSRKS